MDTLNGELVPLGGGDNIPLVRTPLSLGRRESCDVCLPFPNISGLHCEMAYQRGYWTIRDLGSTNGIKVNGSRTMSSPLRPNDEVTIGKRKWTIKYDCSPAVLAELEAMRGEIDEDIMGTSLLEKAGLANPRSRPAPQPRERDGGDKGRRLSLDE